MPDVRRGVYLLPPSVQRYASLLDEALGPGDNEGTLQSTARRRNRAYEAWANAAVRPWALNYEPANTRSEIEAGLLKWSKISARHRRAYRALKQAEAGARTSLSAYYRDRFHLTPKAGRDMARYATELMFRLHFYFLPGSIGPVTDLIELKNPWPAGKSL